MARANESDTSGEISVPVAANGRMVIPVQMRRALGMKAGESLLLRLEKGELRMTTRRRRIEQAQQRAAKLIPRGTSLVEELLAERREAATRE